MTTTAPERSIGATPPVWSALVWTLAMYVDSAIVWAHSWTDLAADAVGSVVGGSLMACWLSMHVQLRGPRRFELDRVLRRSRVSFALVTCVALVVGTVTVVASPSGGTWRFLVGLVAACLVVSTAGEAHVEIAARRAAGPA